MYAQIGDIQFEGLRGFLSFDSTKEAVYAEHALIDGKPALQRLGSKLDEISFSIRFHRSFCDPDEEVGKLEREMNNSTILPLVTGAGRYLGDYVIKSLGESLQRTAADGSTISTELTVSLIEHYAGDKLAQQQKQATAAGFANVKNKPVEVVPLPAVEIPSMEASLRVIDVTAGTAAIQDEFKNATPSSGLLKTKAQNALKKANQLLAGIDKLLAVIDAPDNVGTELYNKTRNLSAACPVVKASVQDVMQACESLITDIDNSNIAGIPATLAQVISEIDSLNGEVSNMREQAGDMIAMAALKK